MTQARISRGIHGPAIDASGTSWCRRGQGGLLVCEDASDAVVAQHHSRAGQRRLQDLVGSLLLADRVSHS